MDIQRIAKDVVNNFTDITGYDVEDVVKLETAEADVLFKHEVIEQTFPDIEECIAEKYDVDARQSQELLAEIDDEIISKIYYN